MYVTKWTFNGLMEKYRLGCMLYYMGLDNYREFTWNDHRREQCGYFLCMNINGRLLGSRL